MDAKRINDLLASCELVDVQPEHYSTNIVVGHNELREVLESLQRIAELPDTWKQRHSRQTWTKLATDSCADELQQALPEGLRK